MCGRVENIVRSHPKLGTFCLQKPNLCDRTTEHVRSHKTCAVELPGLCGRFTILGHSASKIRFVRPNDRGHSTAQNWNLLELHLHYLFGRTKRHSTAQALFWLKFTCFPSFFIKITYKAQDGTKLINLTQKAIKTIKKHKN